MKLSERAHVYCLFAIVCLACALGSLSQTATNSMLGGIQATFDVEVSVSQWLTTIYMLTIGITVPLVTFLSQRLSLKNLVFLALGFFLAGSVMGWVAPAFWILLLGRVLQAVATGITLPVLQTIAMTRFPEGQHGTAMGIAGIAMGFAPNIGPLIGGALVDSWGWRSFFLILAGCMVALVIATALLAAKESAPRGDRPLDFPSFLLSTLGFGGLLLGFSDAASMAVTSPLVWAPALVGVLCLVAFVVRQKRVANPLISMDIFASSNYRVAFAAQNCLFASFMGITLIVPLFVQGPMGLTPLDAGMVFIPPTVLAVVFNPLSGILTDKLGARPVVIGGALFLAVGSVAMVFVDGSMPLWVLTLMQTVRGIGVSSLIGPLNSWGMGGLHFSIMMDASAFFATVRQACASLGTAIMMLFITTGAAMGAAADAGAVLSALPYQLAFGFSAVLALAVLVLAVAKVR